MRLIRKLRDARAGRVMGLAFGVIGLTLYVSYEHRPMFGRWSYPFFGVLVLVAAAWTWLVVRFIHGWKKSRESSQRLTKVAQWFDAGVFLWGAAYLTSALDSSDAAARALDLNLVGSTAPVAVVLEWLSMSAAMVACVGLAWRYRNARWFGFALSVLTLAAMLFGGEGLVRLKAITSPETQGFPTFQSELWSRRHVRLNEAGFRDVAHQGQRADGERRLLLIGDSFAFGSGIARVDNRFGERLAEKLTAATPWPWQTINASTGDVHTLDEIETVNRMIDYQPDVVVLLYVFNDIDYLIPVTERTVLTEHPSTWLALLHPMRVLYRNSYLFQELYVRLRAIRRRMGPSNTIAVDAYRNTDLLATHLGDLARFVSIAGSVGATVGIVPFDIAVTASQQLRERYSAFVARAVSVGLPIWSLVQVFDDHTLDELSVSRLDRHPNELANELAASAVTAYLLEHEEAWSAISDSSQGR